MSGFGVAYFSAEKLLVLGPVGLRKTPKALMPGSF